MYDLDPGHVMEYSQTFGIGVKVLGLKNHRGGSETHLLYLRLCTPSTVHSLTEHLVYNSSLRFNTGDRVRWNDQIHYFKDVVPSKDISVLVQVRKSQQQLNQYG